MCTGTAILLDTYRTQLPMAIGVVTRLKFPGALKKHIMTISTKFINPTMDVETRKIFIVDRIKTKQVLCQGSSGHDSNIINLFKGDDIGVMTG